MKKNVDFTQTNAWKKLKEHFKKIKDVHLKDFFLYNTNRFKTFSLSFKNEMLIDFSKNRITEETLTNLLNLANETNLKDAIYSMFSGKFINFTENRPVLHIALRSKNNSNIYVNNKNIIPDIHNTLQKMKDFSELVINGLWKGYTGESISDIVNIGIGGSDLGPYMVTEALKPYKNHLNVHFISNVDGNHLCNILKKIKAEKTLFLIASKTFNTKETMINANSAKMWFLKKSKDIKYLDKHFFALSAHIENALNFGINIKNIFKFWDWVGGRFSLWSSVGLSIILSIGFNNFEKLLNGANDMDNHFYTANYNENIPIILALISIWYNNFFGSETEAILPYDQNMHRFPAYLQQLNMESNGKSINKYGKKISYHTGPIIWGEPGTNGQHAFFQLLHQGTKLIPCDFIAPVIPHHNLKHHHVQLISNFLAQTRALAFGNSESDLLKELKLFQIKKNNINIKKILKYKICVGNQPTNSILIKKITPYSLGLLIALYEHKIFTQGHILNIFSFDQWGVEIGKKLSKSIYSTLEFSHFKHNMKQVKYDVSTEGLIKFYKSFKK